MKQRTATKIRLAIDIFFTGVFAVGTVIYSWPWNAACFALGVLDSIFAWEQFKKLVEKE